MLQHPGFDATANWQISDGMAVFDTDGAKLGHVHHYAAAAGYLDVQKGVLFTTDVFVPLDAIDTVAEDGVVLKLTKEVLRDRHYSTPPPPPGARSVGNRPPAAEAINTVAVEKEPAGSPGQQAPDAVATGSDRMDPSGMTHDLRKSDERTTGW